MNTSPFFRYTLAALAACLLILVLIFTNVARADEVARAPIVARAVDGVMLQTGWHTYAKQKDAVILYCVRSTPTRLTCAIYVMTPVGNGVALVEDIPASEIES